MLFIPIYHKDYSNTIIIFFHFQSLAAAASFYYGNIFGLNFQLIILLVFCSGTVIVHYSTKSDTEHSADE